MQADVPLISLRGVAGEDVEEQLFQLVRRQGVDVHDLSCLLLDLHNHGLHNPPAQSRHAQSPNQFSHLIQQHSILMISMFILGVFLSLCIT